MTVRPSLLPPQSTALERALEAVQHIRFDAVPVPLRALADPETCPAALLGFLAFAESVDIWDDNWTEAQKRAAIRASFMVHRHKGTIGAVRRALAALDIGLEVREWFDTGDAPGTFRVDTFADHVFDAGLALDARLLTMVAAQIDAIKPASRHYSLRIGEHFATRQPLRTGARAKARQSGSIRPRPEADVETSAAFVRSGFRHRIVHHASHVFEASTL